MLRRSTLYRQLLVPAMLLCATIGGQPALADDAKAAVARLRNDEPHAYEQVVAAGEPAVADLVAVMRDRNLNVPIRLAAANALGEIGSN